MKAVTLAAGVAQKVASAGNRDFINIQNVGAGDAYACYDGSATTVTAANGWLIGANGGELFISNDGNRNVYNHEVWVISTPGTELRIQGEE